MLRPDNFHNEVERILGSIGKSPHELAHSVAAMRTLVAGLRSFCVENFPSTFA